LTVTKRPPKYYKSLQAHLSEKRSAGYSFSQTSGGAAMRATDEIVRSGEIMSTNVTSVGPETSVEQIASILNEKKISGVPVVDAEGSPVGVVSELDIISRSGQIASDIMSSGVITVTEDTPAEDIVEILDSRRVRRVPVISHGKIVGIISRSDLLRLFSHTRWTCNECGYFQRGFHRPEKCSECGSHAMSLERDPPGM
jgi:CBS domain-containing protein